MGLKQGGEIAAISEKCLMLSEEFLCLYGLGWGGEGVGRWSQQAGEKLNLEQPGRLELGAGEEVGL